MYGLNADGTPSSGMVSMLKMTCIGSTRQVASAGPSPVPPPPSSAPAPPLVHGTDQYAIDVELDLAVSCAIKTVRVIVVRWIQGGNRGFVIDFFGVHRSCGSVEAMEIVRHFQTVVYRRGDCLYDVNFTGQALEPK